MFPSNLMAPQVGQRGSKLSPRLWARLIEEGLSPDGSALGVLLVEDFVSVQGYTNADGPVGQFAFDKDSGAACVQEEGVPSAVKLSSGTSDNGAGTLAACGNKGSLGVISDTAGADKLTVFEARIKLASVADGNGSVFVGLADPDTGGANRPLKDDSGHMLANGAGDHAIGFVVLEDDNDSLKFQYRNGSGDVVTVLTYGTALVADQYYNLGFVYDPSAPASEKIKIYIDNVEQGAKVSASSIAASTFPDGKNMTAVASIKSSGNAAESCHIDLLAFYQAG